MFQVPQEEERQVEFPVVPAVEALHFKETTVVGGMFDGIAADNAASYFAGYIASKAEKYHRRHLASNIKNCACCCSILSSKDLSLHIFVSFKEYEDRVETSYGLKYCSENFIRTIIEFERIFLYFFTNFKHLYHFTKITTDFIEQNCDLPSFCSTEMSSFIIKFFVRCRTFQCVKMFNRTLVVKKSKDKIKKIMHQ